MNKQLTRRRPERRPDPTLPMTGAWEVALLTWVAGAETPGDMHPSASATGLGGLSVEAGGDSRGGTGAFGQFGGRVEVSGKGAV